MKKLNPKAGGETTGNPIAGSFQPSPTEGHEQKSKQIDRASWDFSSCPKEELGFCVFYEYIREAAQIHRSRMGSKWSPAAFHSCFSGYFKDGKRIEFADKAQAQVADPFEINLTVKRKFAYAACSCTGFPDTPYLQIPVQERTARIKALALDGLRPDRPGMLQGDFFEICRDPKEGLMYWQYHIAEWVRQNLHNRGEPEKLKPPWIVGYDGFQFELGVIRINWSWKDQKLLDAFKQWLKDNRPPGIQEPETRGSTTMEEHLKFLGAMRLLRSISADEAAALTQRVRGEPLYWEETRWYAAKARAQELMKQLSAPFFDWAEAGAPRR